MKIFSFKKLIKFSLTITLLLAAHNILWAQNDKKTCSGLGEIIAGMPNAGKICCAGLSPHNVKESYDGLCQPQPVGGYAGICLACGDGVCDKKLETKCNCPEDCGVVKETSSDENKNCVELGQVIGGVPGPGNDCCPGLARLGQIRV